jgi:hypothetical protein
VVNVKEELPSATPDGWILRPPIAPSITFGTYQRFISGTHTIRNSIGQDQSSQSLQILRDL